MATKYSVWYELNAPDCEPELMREVASIGEAWDAVRADIAAAAPAGGVPLGEYAAAADLAAYTADPVAPAAIFAQPESVEANRFARYARIAVEGRNTYARSRSAATPATGFASTLAVSSPAVLFAATAAAARDLGSNVWGPSRVSTGSQAGAPGMIGSESLWVPEGTLNAAAAVAPRGRREKLIWPEGPHSG